MKKSAAGTVPAALKQAKTNGGVMALRGRQLVFASLR
jgi:hypothetical protein